MQRGLRYLVAKHNLAPLLPSLSLSKDAATVLSRHAAASTKTMMMVVSSPSTSAISLATRSHLHTSASLHKLNDWWSQKLSKVEKLDTPSKTQSSLLSDLDSVYELQFHRVHPALMPKYLDEYAMFVELMDEKKTGAELAGSWTCLIGDQDEAVHLWKYKGGYKEFYRAMNIYRSDQDIVEYRLRRNEMLRSRYNQILLRFAFWDFKKRREEGNLFEMRSYNIKPGSTIEWGNHWARALKFRQDNNAPVCGFFSHIGDLNMCHHLWAYKDLQSRKDTREVAWSRPGWDENVRYTVPLIRSLRSRILIPTPFSPLK